MLFTSYKSCVLTEKNAICSPNSEAVWEQCVGKYTQTTKCSMWRLDNKSGFPLSPSLTKQQQQQQQKSNNKKANQWGQRQPYHAHTGLVQAKYEQARARTSLYHARTGPARACSVGVEVTIKVKRKKWWRMAVIMSMNGVPIEVSGCDSNFECNWRYKWIKLTVKVNERDENGGWMKGECNEDKSVWKWRETNTVTMKVFTRNTEGGHFVCCSADWKCASYQWKCTNGKCIHKDFACDGFDNCGDDSDERNCGKLVFMTMVVVIVVIVAAWAFDVESICNFLKRLEHRQFKDW